MRFVRCRAGSYRHDIPVSNDSSVLLGRVGSPKNEVHRIIPQNQMPASAGTLGY